MDTSACPAGFLPGNPASVDLYAKVFRLDQIGFSFTTMKQVSHILAGVQYEPAAYLQAWSRRRSTYVLKSLPGG